jgi:hypothetical protein
LKKETIQWSKEKGPTTIYKTLHNILKIGASLFIFFRNAFRYIFSWVRVTRSLVLRVCFAERCLGFFCTFSFGHCFVCSSSIYVFWLPLWYCQALLQIHMHSKQREWIQTKRRKGYQSNIRTKQKDEHNVINWYGSMFVNYICNFDF